MPACLTPHHSIQVQLASRHAMESMYGTGASERSGPLPKPVSEWVPSAVLAQRARAALVKAWKKDAVINRKGAAEAGGSACACGVCLR